MDHISRRTFFYHGAALAGIWSAAAAANVPESHLNLWNRMGWAPGKLAAIRRALENGEVGALSHIQLEAPNAGPVNEALEAGVAAALFIAPELKLERSWLYGIEDDGPFAMLVGESASRQRVVIRLNAPGKCQPVTVNGAAGTLAFAGLGNVQLTDGTDRVVKEFAAMPVPDTELNMLAAAARATVAKAGRTARQQHTRQG